MAALGHLNSVSPPVPAASTTPADPTSHVAHALAGSDPATVIDAQEADLADYLNRPVNDILSRLGLPPVHDGAPSPSAQDPQTSSEPPNPVDPTQLIRPVTDALGTLGTGQTGNPDPTQMFETISQAVESAGQSVGPALSALSTIWQGAAATAAAAKTGAVLKDGSQVIHQATELGASLSTAIATVGQARARLVAIIAEFAAKIAVIGPNLPFPWGLAAAIEAANEAITETSEVVSETQSTLATQATHVSAVGAPVDVTAVPQLATTAAGFAPAVSGAAPALGQAIGPAVELATSVASPAMEGVGAITGAIQAGSQSAANGRDPADGSAPNDPAGKTPGSADANGAPLSGALAGGPPAGGGAALIPPTRQLASLAPVGSNTSTTVRGDGGVLTPAATGGAPMMGGAPLGQGARAGADRGHNAAAFLHTTLQGDEIVGDLGSVGPPVVGERDAIQRPDIELRI